MPFPKFTLIVLCLLFAGCKPAVTKGESHRVEQVKNSQAQLDPESLRKPNLNVQEQAKRALASSVEQLTHRHYPDPEKGNQISFSKDTRLIKRLLNELAKSHRRSKLAEPRLEWYEFRAEIQFSGPNGKRFSFFYDPAVVEAEFGVDFVRAYDELMLLPKRSRKITE